MSEVRCLCISFDIFTLKSFITMKKEILIILVLLTSLISMHAANLTSPPISIVPRPAQVVPGEGNFTFSSQTLFSVENHEQAVIVRNFINLLKRSSGITPQLAIGGSEKSHVCFTTDSSLKKRSLSVGSYSGTDSGKGIGYKRLFLCITDHPPIVAVGC